MYNQIIVKLNPNQYGSVKKSSTSHYLISLYDFIFKALDTPNTYVIIVLLDLSKAFDLVDHNTLIQALLELNVNVYDVYWVADFLRNRQQCTRDKNLLSAFLSINNGTPQGTKLACLLFIVLIDKVLKDFYENCKNESNTMKAFVDDMCLAEAVKYDQKPNMEVLVNRVNSTLKNYKMCLNAKKCNVIIIDNSLKKTYSNIKIKIGDVTLPVLSESKLLGVIINNKGNWSNHINMIYGKACKKLYMIRKLKSVGLSSKQLVSIYSIHIRSVLEYSCMLWAFSLNNKQIELLSSIERRVLSVIMGRYVSRNKHKDVCKSISLATCIERHYILLNKFSKKLLRNERFQQWLDPYRIIRKSNYSARYNKNKHNFRLVKCKYERYKKSTLPILIKFLHDNA